MRQEFRKSLMTELDYRREANNLTLAIVLFLLAAGAAMCVLVSVVLSDLPQRRRG